PYNSSVSSTINADAEYYGGPYDVYVSGLSSGGVPTASTLSAEQAFYVQPYVYTSNEVMTDLQQTSRLALWNVTIQAGSAPVTLSDDYFLGNDTVSGSAVTISSSTVNGTLDIENGATTLSGVTGGDVVATNALVVFQHSSLSSLVFGTASTGSVDPASSFQSVTPALPDVTISSPAGNASYTGTVDAQVVVQGTGITSVSFSLDGKLLPSIQGNASSSQPLSYPLNTTSLPDGTHTLVVTAVQSDLMSTTASVSVETHNQFDAVTSYLSESLSSADSRVASMQTTLNGMADLVYLALVVALVAIALAAYSVRGKSPWKY
ncbi:MAG: Ig-like domain-containing protein, partial [Nitrososphaerales archaeon]